MVVDRFEWSDSENRSYPGVAEPEGSFRSAFEKNIQETEFEVLVIESDIRDAVLPENTTFSFCFYDGPRSAEDIHYILCMLSTSFSADGQILIKNVFGSRAPEVAAYVNALLGLNVVELLPTDQPAWCNIAVLTPGPAWSQLTALEFESLLEDAPVPAAFSDPWYGHSTTIVRILWLASVHRWGHAIALLRNLPHLTENQSAFDEFEDNLGLGVNQPEMSAIFSVFKHLHQDHALETVKPLDVGTSVENRLRLIWDSVPDDLWQSERLNVTDAFTERFEKLHREIEGHVASIRDKDIAIIGPHDPELEWICLICGAQTITSVLFDTEVETLQATRLKRVHLGLDDTPNFDIAFISELPEDTERFSEFEKLPSVEMQSAVSYKT
ncbi:hypothetical protein [Cognatishimia activa]|uniref:hypothetical protein n=1 Tax=Cognatishimia activa TaxID=1715691 RepID=UPI00103B1BCD|nr:hypothetical protein [Cognatishimia activa]